MLLEAIPPSIDRVAGYSLGGRVALGMIRLEPERFRAATILSAHPGLSDPGLRAERQRQDSEWIRILREDGIQAFVRAWEQQPLFQTQSRLTQELRQRQRERRLAQRPEGLAAALECLGLGAMPSTWEALGRYRGHLEWIVGGADSRFLEIARRVQADRPETRLEVLDGSGHNLLLEAPQAVRALLVSETRP